MTMLSMEPRPPQAPAVVGGLGNPPETSEPDAESGRLKEKLHRLQLEISKTHEAQQQADLERKIRQDVERQFKDRMEALREAQEDAKKEIELARVAAETAALERLEEARKAEEERRRIEADLRAQAAREERERIEIEKKAEEKRAQAHAAALAEVERAAMAKLQKEMSAAADRKLQLDRERTLLEHETRTKLMAELKVREEASPAVDSTNRRAEALEAREKKVFEAEIMNKCTTELMAREKAVFEAEIRNKYSRELQLDARERALLEAETKQKYAAELAAQWEAETTSDDSRSDDTGTARPYYWYLDDNGDDSSFTSVAGQPLPGGQMVAYKQSSFVCNERGQVQEHEMKFSDSQSAHAQKSVPFVQPNEERQLEGPSNKMLKADTSDARVPFDIDAVYNSTNTRDLTIHLDLELTRDIDDEIEEFSRLSRLGNYASAESFFDLNLRAHFSTPSLFVQYADMLLEKGDFKALMLLDESSVFARRDSGEPQDLRSEIDKLKMNWKLIRAITLCHSQHKLHTVWDVVKDPFRSIRDTSHIGSTEASNYLLHLGSYIKLYVG